MKAFLPGIHQAGNGKLQFTQDGVLLVNFHVVRFYKGIPVFRYIFVFTAVSIQWVETDPCASFRIVIAKHGADIPFTGI